MEDNKIAWRVTVLMALLCLLFIILLSRRDNMIKAKASKVRTVYVDSSESFSPDKLFKYILDVGIKFPKIAYCQAKLESGNFTSHIFKENNNLFGMKVARSRPTTALCESIGHAKYKDWKLCVTDYALFQSAYARKIRSEEEYFNYLGRTYAEDGSYVEKLKKIYYEETENI